MRDYHFSNPIEMFDTIHFRLQQTDLQSRVDFLGDLPGLLTDVATTERENGSRWIKGNLGNLTINANDFSMFVGYGSLCKWYLGDNFKALGMGDTKRAIECLSDMLHLPMSEAAITRVDVAGNFIMRYPASVYFDYLGDLRATKRLQQPDGVYYRQNNKQALFYDKLKEEKKHREPIPELYAGKNVLRYEHRLIGRLPKVLKVPEVKAAMLYQREFYNTLLNQWSDTYKAIYKISKPIIDFKMVTTKKDLFKWGLLAGIERVGGQTEMLRQIAEAQKRGELTNKQAYDLRAAVKSACLADGGMATESDAIQELDMKVAEAVKMFC